MLPRVNCLKTNCYCNFTASKVSTYLLSTCKLRYAVYSINFVACVDVSSFSASSCKSHPQWTLDILNMWHRP